MGLRIKYFNIMRVPLKNPVFKEVSQKANIYGEIA